MSDSGLLSTRKILTNRSEFKGELRTWGLEHVIYGERLEEAGLVLLGEKTRIVVFRYLCGGHRQHRARFFFKIHSKRTIVTSCSKEISNLILL